MPPGPLPKGVSAHFVSDPVGRGAPTGRARRRTAGGPLLSAAAQQEQGGVVRTGVPEARVVQEAVGQVVQRPLADRPCAFPRRDTWSLTSAPLTPVTKGAAADRVVPPVGTHDSWDPPEEGAVGRLDGVTIPSGRPAVACDVPPRAARPAGSAPRVEASVPASRRGCSGLPGVPVPPRRVGDGSPSARTRRRSGRGNGAPRFRPDHGFPVFRRDLERPVPSGRTPRFGRGRRRPPGFRPAVETTGGGQGLQGRSRLRDR